PDSLVAFGGLAVLRHLRFMLADQIGNVALDRARDVGPLFLGVRQEGLWRLGIALLGLVLRVPPLIGILGLGLAIWLSGLLVLRLVVGFGLVVGFLSLLDLDLFGLLLALFRLLRSLVRLVLGRVSILVSIWGGLLRGFLDGGGNRIP